MATAIVMARNGDFQGAIILLKDALKQYPCNAEAHYDLGLALLGTGDNPQTWAEAMEQFRLAVKMQPKYPEARNMLGVGMLVSGDPEGSITELKFAVNEAPEIAEIHLNLGKAFAAMDQWKDASEEFQKAIEIRHPYPEAKAQLGNALLNQGKTAIAESAFLDALRGDPDIESAHYGLARTLQAEDKPTAAKVEYSEARALLQRKSDAIMSSNLSNQSLELAAHGEPLQAAKMAERAVELAPDNWRAIYNYGLLLADTGNLRGGIDEIRKSISLMPLRRQLYIAMAQMQKQAGDAAAATCTSRRAGHLLEIATAKAAERVQILESAKCQASDGQFAFGASFGDVVEHRAFARYLSNKGDLLGASGELLYAIKLAPSRPDIRYDLAILWLQMGRSMDAQMELQKILILSPKSASAHFALGTVLAEHKDYKAAEEQFHQSLSLDPANQEAQRMLDEIVSQTRK